MYDCIIYIYITFQLMKLVIRVTPYSTEFKNVWTILRLPTIISLYSAYFSIGTPLFLPLPLLPLSFLLLRLEKGRCEEIERR